MIILISIIIFLLGVIQGFCLCLFLRRKSRYIGSIIVTKDEEKTVYSLELDEDPENLEFKKEVWFKIQAS